MDVEAVVMPANVDPEVWALTEAQHACVWGCPGWVGTPDAGGPGAVNLRRVSALSVQQNVDDEGTYHLVASSCCTAWTVEAGPYLHEHDAGWVARALVQLSCGPDEDWPRDDEGGHGSSPNFMGETP